MLHWQVESAFLFMKFLDCIEFFQICIETQGEGAVSGQYI